jgi:DNA-binding response OmpR family regulator
MEEKNKKKVLVVDDDNNLRSVLVDKLNISGFDAVGAFNGEDGLERALNLHPDIILLDIIMPVMDCWEMLKKLREDKWGEKAKVIVLTVVEDTEAIARAVQDGSFAYFIKTDHGIDEIVVKVKEMLKGD